ncbi:MAG: hypothetical protein MAG453_00956 [Calditrichaeota bacterium]|nr:hypothetical protein [Calditrichota bacterium]
MAILYEQESYEIRGAMIEVHQQIGAGFLESVYQECLEREFKLRSVPYRAQPKLTISYKGEMINQTYQPDFVCYGKIVVELKSVKELSPQHEAQVFNYLRAADLRLGFLVNFSSHPKVTIKRIIF